MNKPSIKRIGLLTGGGDCPGLNAVIRAVTKAAQSELNLEVMGIEDSYVGLLQRRARLLHNRDVSGILPLGGTILGTARDNPFRVVEGLGERGAREDDTPLPRRHERTRHRGPCHHRRRRNALRRQSPPSSRHPRHRHPQDH
ncbi:MAG: 6-phosphofructokinase [bacterium]